MHFLHVFLCSSPLSTRFAAHFLDSQPASSRRSRERSTTFLIAPNMSSLQLTSAPDIYLMPVVKRTLHFWYSHAWVAGTVR